MNMINQHVKFSVNQLIIGNNGLFGVDTFLGINEEDTEKQEFTSGDDNKEILHIKRIVKKVVEGRFVTVYFNYGDKYPYSPKVMGPDLKEYDNPRAPEQIELDGQFFVLIDAKTQRVFVSDQKKRGSFSLWLKDKLQQEIVIKSIIDEKDFIQKIDSVSKISFSLVPNLFNSVSGGILSSALVQDMFGFDAERACVELEYSNKKITQKMISKIESLLNQKDRFEKIVVIGRSEENLESTFNLNEIVTKIEILVPTNKEDRIFNHETVFERLIREVKVGE